MKTASKPQRSLVAFVQDKKRASCAVCGLPVEIRGQLAAAREKKIHIALQVLWLKEEVKVDVSADELSKHRSSKHEAPAL